jgi:hypothetical protein
MRALLTLSRAIAVACAVLIAPSCGGSAASVAPSTAGGGAATSAVVSDAPSIAASRPPAPTFLWPAPSDPMERTVQAGLKPQPKEFMTNHVHAHLDVFVDGKPVTVPSGIGIKIDDPAVRHQDEADGSVSYGGIEMCNEACISPLHTHDITGILHTESAAAEFNTLGEFFTEWGVALDASCVATFCSPAMKIAIYVDGELSTGDPRAIELTDHREIAIVVGTPPPEIPKTADFSNA